MYGLINISIKNLILEEHGDGVWKKILKKADLSDQYFVSNQKYDDKLKLWYRLESEVYLKFGPYGQKGWKVLARLEPVNQTTEKDRRWRAINVLPFPGVPDSEIYPYLPKIADEASRCDACQNLRYRTDTYLLVSPKGKHEILKIPKNDK